MEVDDIIVEEIDLVEEECIQNARAHVPEEEETHSNVPFIFQST